MSDLDFWSAVFIQAISAGHSTNVSEALADKAVEIRDKRWPVVKK